MHKINKIYLDMDGVMADFNGRFKELYGMSPKKADKTGEFDKLFRNFVETKQFENLGMLPGAVDLINYCKKASPTTEILSSTHSEEYKETIAKQKGIWLQKHNIPFKQNYVAHHDMKDKYATPNSVIVDDTKEVIKQWRKAGGIGIHNKDALESMAKLAVNLDNA